jgi:hypothetical protein
MTFGAFLLRSPCVIAHCMKHELRPQRLGTRDPVIFKSLKAVPLYLEQLDSIKKIVHLAKSMMYVKEKGLPLRSAAQTSSARQKSRRR